MCVSWLMGDVKPGSKIKQKKDQKPIFSTAELGDWPILDGPGAGFIPCFGHEFRSNH